MIITVPSASPQLLRCTATSPSTVDVTWQPPPVSEHNGLIQHYRLQYQAVINDASNGGGSNPVKTVQGLYVTLTGLAPHSVYRVRVSAVNRIGSGPLSPSVTCVTDETGQWLTWCSSSFRFVVYVSIVTQFLVHRRMSKL